VDTDISEEHAASNSRVEVFRKRKQVKKVGSRNMVIEGERRGSLVWANKNGEQRFPLSYTHEP
jgi:hypothetical protein